MSKVPLPGNGCYVATQATSTWQEVPCLPPSSDHLDPAAVSGGGPREVVGGHLGVGVDFEAKTGTPISWAEGSFPIITGLTTETDSFQGTNKYTLQLNTNRLSGTALCSGASVPANCRGWQQFAYRPGGLFMEYWLIAYNNTCPSNWNFTTDFAGNGDCYINTTIAPVPSEPITNLTNMTLVGQSGSSDTVLFSNGNDTLWALRAASVLGLNNGGWTNAEFNVFGYGNGSRANFPDPNVVMVVQTLTNTTPVTTTAPACLSQTETGETNSLTLTSDSCCPVGGSAPGVQFMQSNNGAGKQPCPLFPSQIQVPVAFQANTKFLWIDQNGNGLNQAFGMKPGTVPSLVTIPGGVATGFQADFGNFWLDQNGGGTDSGIAMQAASSPSIARLSGGQIAVAFQGANGHLWLGTNGPLSATDRGFAMKAGSSPSLVAVGFGQYAVGFQGANGHFWLDQNGTATDSMRAMQGSTSPSIGAFDEGGVLVAFQGANGNLWVGVNGVLSSTDQGLGMKANTSPSAAVMSDDNSTTVAFQANTSVLWLWRNGSGFGTGLGMFGASPPASPILSAMPGNGYQVAFKANTGNLWIDLNGNGMDQHFGMN